MDAKLKIFSMGVLLFVVVCLIAVLALVWTMPDLPKTVKKGEICLPSETGPLKCGSTADLLHDYLERVSLHCIHFFFVFTFFFTHSNTSTLKLYNRLDLVELKSSFM
jgi:hypothetical protein